MKKESDKTMRWIFFLSLTNALDNPLKILLVMALDSRANPVFLLNRYRHYHEFASLCLRLGHLSRVEFSTLPAIRQADVEFEDVEFED